MESFPPSHCLNPVGLKASTRFCFLPRFCLNCLVFSIPTPFLGQALTDPFEFSHPCCGLTGLCSVFGPVISTLFIATKSDCETPQLKSISVQSSRHKTYSLQHHIILKLFEYLFVLHWLKSLKTGTLSNHFWYMNTISLKGTHFMS